MQMQLTHLLSPKIRVGFYHVLRVGDSVDRMRNICRLLTSLEYISKNLISTHTVKREKRYDGMARILSKVQISASDVRSREMNITLLAVLEGFRS
jgi:hypothetical protein